MLYLAWRRVRKREKTLSPNDVDLFALRQTALKVGMLDESRKEISLEWLYPGIVSVNRAVRRLGCCAHS